jgi:heptaprenyl diphosphate synthase
MSTSVGLRGDLDALSDTDIERVADSAGLGGALRDSCAHLLGTRGKKLRSSIVLESAKLGSDADPEAVRRAALAVELFHLGTLSHDDVVDDGQVRRGERTVLAEHGPIMAGVTAGWLFGRSLELVADCGAATIQAFVDAACEVCEGEMQDLQDFNDVERSVERYIDTIDKKTASLLRLPAVAGAILAGGDDRTVAALRSYGHDLGLAFQISDDILDLSAPESTTGKKRGIDLQQGVYTLPVILAMERLPELRSTLAGELRDEAIPDVVDAIRSTGALEASTEACERHVAAAKEALEGVAFADEVGKERLLSIADFTIERVFRMVEPAA